MKNSQFFYLSALIWFILFILTTGVLAVVTLAVSLVSMGLSMYALWKENKEVL